MKKPLALLAIAAIISVALCAQVKKRVKIGNRYADSLAELGYVISDSMKFHLVGIDSLIVEGAWKDSRTVIIPPCLAIGGKDYAVTGLKVSAFENNTDIQSVSLPPSVTEIASSAFRECSRLNHCEMPNVREIGASAFFRTGFERLVLPEGVGKVGYMAYTECPMLRYVELPSSLASIGDMAFMCDRLDTVKVNFRTPIDISTKVFWSSVSLNRPRKKIVLVVPKDCKEAFSQADGWKYFQAIVEN